MSEFKGPIVEGAYYLRGDGNVALSKTSTVPGMVWVADVLYHTDCGIVADPLDSGERTRLTRRVYITHTDPAEVDEKLRVMTAMDALARESNGHLQQVAIMAKDDLRAFQAKAAEVVAELTARSETAYAKQTAYDGGYHQAVSNAYESAADLVESMLGLARCGEGCDGNCELTAHGPTKAEAEVAELRSKAAEIVAELRVQQAIAEANLCAGHPGCEVDGWREAADLVTEKLVGGK